MRLLDLIQCFLTSDTKIDLFVRIYALVKKKALHDCEAELLVVDHKDSVFLPYLDYLNFFLAIEFEEFQLS